MQTNESSDAKRTLIVQIIKTDLFTDYDRLQVKFTEYEIWVRYQAYLLRYRQVMVKT